MSTRVGCARNLSPGWGTFGDYSRGGLASTDDGLSAPSSRKVTLRGPKGQ